MACSNVTRLLKFVGDGILAHAIRDRLERDAINMHSIIGEHTETFASLQRTKDELEREISNVGFLVQAQTGAIGRLERGTKTAADNSAALAETQPTLAMLASEHGTRC